MQTETEIEVASLSVTRSRQMVAIDLTGQTGSYLTRYSPRNIAEIEMEAAATRE